MNLNMFSLEIYISDMAGAGFMVLLLVPVLLLIAIILAIAKQNKAAKKVLIAAGICTLIGAGLCGLG